MRLLPLDDGDLLRAALFKENDSPTLTAAINAKPSQVLVGLCVHTSSPYWNFA